jgi:hypothetical protein
MQHIKEKQHKHNKYVNVGEIYDRRGPYRLKSIYKSAVFSEVYRTLITAINNQKACCR